MTFLSELEGLLAEDNKCDNCGILPADTTLWDTAQTDWAKAWRDWLLLVIAGTANSANRPPRKPPL